MELNAEVQLQEARVWLNWRLMETDERGVVSRLEKSSVLRFSFVYFVCLLCE